MDFFNSFPYTTSRGKNRALDWVLEKIKGFQKEIDKIPEYVREATNGSSGVNVDKSLTVDGAAADAKTVGDKFGSLTAADVGARPNTWTPTAEDVGAWPNTWTPTAADVGARPSGWMPTAEDVGARPNTWTPTAADVGALPVIEDPENPGCYYVMRGDNKAWLNPPHKGGVEYLTMDFFAGKPVYSIVVGTGDLPSAGTKEVNFSNYVSNVRQVLSICGSSSQGHVIPYYDGSLRIEVSMLGSIIKVTTNQAISGYPYAELIVRYTKM